MFGWITGLLDFWICGEIVDNRCPDSAAVASFLNELFSWEQIYWRHEDIYGVVPQDFLEKLFILLRQKRYGGQAESGKSRGLGDMKPQTIRTTQERPTRGLREIRERGEGPGRAGSRRQFIYLHFHGDTLNHPIWHPTLYGVK
jgi:hypothetical protein